MIAEATHQCGDPGMQFDTTINDWHTCPNTGRINASNPCSEYMHLDDSACNLASLNLMQFIDDGRHFDVAPSATRSTSLITAQDIVVEQLELSDGGDHGERARLPRARPRLRQPGALLMSLGLPYDSEAGRQYAGAVTALMCGEAYLQSARIAGDARALRRATRANREPQLRVIDKHRAHAHKLNPTLVPLDLLAAARDAWDDALATAQDARRPQLAGDGARARPGTIAFMMDCDTTGVEPDIALVKYKKLVGGGVLKIVNNTVPRRAEAPRLRLARGPGASSSTSTSRRRSRARPRCGPSTSPVFDCAFKPARGARSIHPLGHLRMMGAVQPFISGAISKTINMPEQATVEDIEQAYIEAWRLGLKAVAIYRDGCKKTQPLNTAKPVGEAAARDRRGRPDAGPAPAARRSRQAICHKFDIAGHEGYIHVGFYEDGTPGEIFIKMAKEGSTISGLMDTIGVLTSMALQYGVPLEVLVPEVQPRPLRAVGLHQEPRDPDGEVADRLHLPLPRLALPAGRAEGGGRAGRARGAVARRRRARSPTAPPTRGPSRRASRSASRRAAAQPLTPIAFSPQADAPSCPDCGSIMVRNGTCYKCLNCGATSGCS